MTKPVTPLLTVDIIYYRKSGLPEIVLVERKYEPFGWALPGGFVEVGESTQFAASRELQEETKLDVPDWKMKLFGVYSQPKRDPRGHNVSIVYCCEPQGQYWLDPVGSDDAKDAKFFSITRLPELVFDHRQIIEDFIKAEFLQ